MTPAEFNREFYPHAVAAFPSIKTTLGREFKATKTHEREVTQGEIMAVWQRTLGSVEVEEGKAAVDSLLRSDWQAPYALEEYLTAILGAVQRRRNQTADRSYKPVKRIYCNICLDTGMAEVWSPMAHKAAREQPDQFIAGKISTAPVSVPCKCGSGARMLHLGAGHRYGSGNPKDVGMVLYPGRVAFDGDGRRLSDEEMRRELVEILAERDADAPRRQGQIEYQDASGFPT